jgi:aldose 1-epimerase
LGYTLRNSNGMSLTVLALGGIIQRLTAADKRGSFDDVVLGFDAESDYERPHPYFGALIGRYANRIARGRFAVDGTECTLACNDGNNHLHGGSRGFDKVTWQVEATDQELRLQHVSADGEEGYPGELEVTVRYSLTDDDSLRIDYRAEASKPTPVNLTSHPYFNLAGEGSILGHELEILATRFTPIGADLIPAGSTESVAGTPLDFRQSVVIGERIQSEYEQIRNAGGYDHNWVLDLPLRHA